MLQYDELGRVKMVCDICTKETPFYNTVQELFTAVNFGAPITSDAGSTSWIYGPGKKLIGPGYQPTFTADHKKHACPSCKTAIEGLVYTSDYNPFDVKVGQQPKFGDAARQSRDEDYQMNKPLSDLIKETNQQHPTPIVPRIFPKNEPDFTHDEHYKPFGEQGEEGTG